MIGVDKDEIAIQHLRGRWLKEKEPMTAAEEPKGPEESSEHIDDDLAT